ncbi:melanocyte-stimulating hormone receptor-like [Acropora millepora]|uniref:melanocyte-stimulating hormone receptor-like n=1 Tax=Acropora millepora TaxID=45264 RepID=UPI001CF2F550|nr:melanocyte-stimulating hormone receptor-like [Acropora millepora]
MQAQEFFANSYCSEEFHQGLDNEILSLSVINILLGITASVGNTVILIALHKETSLHKPSKVLLHNLVASDLCAGFVQFVYGAQGISILQRRLQICHLLYLVYGIAGNISIPVSLSTITAISVDRLLALLLKIRYRQVVTLRKVYVVAIASWVCNSIGFASLWYFSHNTRKVLSVLTIAVCLFTSAYCYIRIFIRLRHQHNQVSNLREVQNQQRRADTKRYRKTVWSALWLQIAMLLCYLPYLLLASFAFRKNIPLSVLVTPTNTTLTLTYFNSTLNPILYCWRIVEVRRAVKNLLHCSQE